MYSSAWKWFRLYLVRICCLLVLNDLTYIQANEGGIIFAAKRDEHQLIDDREKKVNLERFWKKNDISRLKKWFLAWPEARNRKSLTAIMNSIS
jgi:hypothetical protein